MRLDAALVARALARSRGDARDLVNDGLVTVNGVPARKPSAEVATQDDVAVLPGRAARVGRAAHKLQSAFDAWGSASEDPLSAAGRRCLDVGASTGGFTQVLLEAGAAHVVALDVGHGQLAPELAGDPRVTNLEGRNVRAVTPDEVGGPFALVVADLSFISLQLVAPQLAALTAADGQGVWLVKPQFEVGRERLGKRGVVTDPGDQARALRAVLAAARACGLHPRAVLPSPLAGTRGNREYLLWVSRRRELGLVEDTVAIASVVPFEENRPKDARQAPPGPPVPRLHR